MNYIIENARAQWLLIFDGATLEERRLLLKIGRAFERNNLGEETAEDRRLIAMAKRMVENFKLEQAEEEKRARAHAGAQAR